MRNRNPHLWHSDSVVSLAATARRIVALAGALACVLALSGAFASNANAGAFNVGYCGPNDPLPALWWGSYPGVSGVGMYDYGQWYKQGSCGSGPSNSFMLTSVKDCASAGWGGYNFCPAAGAGWLAGWDVGIPNWDPSIEITAALNNRLLMAYWTLFTQANPKYDPDKPPSALNKPVVPVPGSPTGPEFAVVGAIDQAHGAGLYAGGDPLPCAFYGPGPCGSSGNYGTTGLSGSTTIAYWVWCANPSNGVICNSYAGNQGGVAAWQASLLQVNDTAPPAVDTSTSWRTECWYTSAGQSACGNTGAFNMAGTASDISTVNGKGSTIDGVLQAPQATEAAYTDAAVCQRRTDGIYAQATPCPGWVDAPTNLDHSFPIGAGAYAEGRHVLALTASDPGANVGSGSRDLLIDNTNMLAGDSSDNLATAPVCNYSTVKVSEPTPTSWEKSNWLSGTVKVRGWACDTLSGISSGSVQYQTAPEGSGSWSGWAPFSSGSGKDGPQVNSPDCNLPSTPMGMAANSAISQITCDFDTSGFPQGTQIRFRTVATNGAAFAADSAPTAAYSIDNSPPHMSKIHARAIAPTGSVKEIDTANQRDGNADGGAFLRDTRWTNATRVEFWWDDKNAYHGDGTRTPLADDSNDSAHHGIELPSSHTAYEYKYFPDADGDSDPSACPVRTGTLDTDATSVQFDENRTQACRQGLHTLYLRVRDGAGNWSVPDSRWNAITRADASTCNPDVDADSNFQEPDSWDPSQPDRKHWYVANNRDQYVRACFYYDSYPTPQTKDLAWPCAAHTQTSNCFTPADLRVTAPGPSQWSPVNSFAVAWTNPTFNGAVPAAGQLDEAPIFDALIRGPFNIPGATTRSGGVSTWAGCLSSGVGCSLAGINIDPDVGGTYPFKLWMRDKAGNADEEQSQSVTLNYLTNQCLRP